jgi:hypothetical protein
LTEIDKRFAAANAEGKVVLDVSQTAGAEVRLPVA